MTMVLRAAVIMAALARALGVTECLMIGKVYEEP